MTESSFDPSDTYIIKSIQNQYVKIRSETSKSDSDLVRKFQRKIVQFSLLFQSRSSPYKGIITSNTECFDKSSVKPAVADENSSVAIFTTKATRNFAFGKCDGEDQMYYSIYAIILCKKNQVLYDVKFFTREPSDLKKFKIKCLK